MARWARAAHWLPPHAQRVLDVGCAFGYGTAHVAQTLDSTAARRGDAGPRVLVVGLEYDPDYARDARRCYPRLAVVRGSAESLPFPDGCCDALLLLDVLEHLPHPAAAVAEAARVLRPGGALLLSVPHRGLLGWADSLNLYSMLRGHLPMLRPLDPTERGYPNHRHYGVPELRALLGREFAIQRLARTGLGLAEPLHLVILVVCRGVLRSEAAYRALRFLYYGLYLLEDLLPTGRFGYHIMVHARRLEAHG